ncbi:MAG: polyprenol monophosphomannose synthase [Chloroflexi bacterium]|nr:polyprenol monophosphomannose synthase [Chloroflexota bacterium]
MTPEARPKPAPYPARKVTVVLPTYNEAANLPKMLERLLALEPPVDVLVVDDSSPDGTGAIADEYVARHPGRISVLHRITKSGLGDAYIAGFRQALDRGAERIVEMDADFSHPIDALPAMFRLAEEYDVVVGSRYVKGGGVDRRWSPLRRFVSWGGNVYARLVTGLRVHDTTAGFKCFRREALERIPLPEVRSQGYNFQIEMALRCQRAGLRVAELPIYFRERDAGVSKMTPGIALEALWRLWQLRYVMRKR